MKLLAERLAGTLDSVKMHHIAITGARGFIGAHLIRHLDKRGFDYAALKRSDDDFIYPSNWEEFNAIIHMAARVHLKNSRKTNLSYTLNLAEKAVNSNIRHFIFVSSVGVLGEFSGESPFDANSPYNPHDDYSISKMEAEEGLKRVFQNTDVNLTIIRPPLVYGSSAKGNFQSLSKLVRKMPILPVGSIKSERSFCSVNNLCDLIITCLTNEKSYNQTFLVSDDITIALVDMIKIMYKSLDKTCLIVPVPYSLMYLAGLITGKTRALNKLNNSLILDISHTKEILGWSPHYAMEQEISRALHDDQAV